MDSHLQSRRIFLTALGCSVALHGLVFAAFTLWPESRESVTEKEKFKIQKVRLVTSSPTASHPESPQESKHALVDRVPEEMRQPRFQKMQPMHIAKRITPPAPLQWETQPEKPIPFQQGKTFSATRMMRKPVTVRPKEPVQPRTKARLAFKKEIHPHSPMVYSPPQPGRSTLAQSNGWEPPPGKRYAHAVQPTLSFAGTKQTTKTGQRHSPREETTQLHSEETNFSIPTASWTGAQTVSKEVLKEPITEKGSNTAPPSQEKADAINSDFDESAPQQFASKGFTGSDSGREDLNALKNGFILEIRNRIAKHKFYPRLARRRGLEGQPVVHFKITRSGIIQDLHVALSSGSGILDDAALESVKQGAPFPVIPKALNRDSLTIQLPIAFTLD